MGRRCRSRIFLQHDHQVIGNGLSCLSLGNSSTSSTKLERVRYRKTTIGTPRRHLQVSRGLSRGRADPMYSHPPRRSVRYVLVDRTQKNDCDPLGTKDPGRKATRYPSRRNSETNSQSSYDRVRRHALDQKSIEEQLRQNLIIARHNADIAARPALTPEKRVRFSPVVRIG